MRKQSTLTLLVTIAVILSLTLALRQERMDLVQAQSGGSISSHSDRQPAMDAAHYQVSHRHRRRRRRSVLDRKNTVENLERSLTFVDDVDTLIRKDNNNIKEQDLISDPTGDVVPSASGQGDQPSNTTGTTISITAVPAKTAAHPFPKLSTNSITTTIAPITTTTESDTQVSATTLDTGSTRTYVVTSDPSTRPPTTTDIPTTTDVSPIPTTTTVGPSATTRTTTDPPETTKTTTAATTTTEAPVTTTTAITITTSTDPPVTVTTLPVTNPPTNPPVTNPTAPTTARSASQPVTSSGSGHSTGRSAVPSATTSSDAAARPSNAASSGSSSSSNKTAITIGVVIGAIVIAAGIGVWVFRKWKLSPSRQFKSKIRNSSVGGVGGGAIGSAHGDDADDYDNYTDIFRPPAHDSALPAASSMLAGSGAASGAAAAAVATTGGSSVAGSSPPLHHQPYQYDQYDQYDQYGQYDQQSRQPHLSMASSGITVPDYSQYRYAQSSQRPMMSSHHLGGGVEGYDSGVHEAVLGGSGGYGHGAGIPGGMSAPHHVPYSSHEYGGEHGDHFLRELRE